MARVSRSTAFVYCLGLCLSLLVVDDPVRAEGYSKRQAEIFETLTAGVGSLGREGWRFSAIAPLKSNVVPLFWGDRKGYTGDIRWPQNSYPPVAIASEYQKGRFVALGHAGLLVDPSADDAFTGHIFTWLGNGYPRKNVIIYTHLGAWFNKKILTAKATQMLEGKGIGITELSSQVTDDDLKQCDVLVIVRPLQPISDEEVHSIVSYVAQGGSLLVAGERYFWEGRRRPRYAAAYPLDKLGERLGFEYSKASLNRTWPDNRKNPRRYSIVDFHALDTRRPIPVKVFSTQEHGNSRINQNVAIYKDEYQYAVEGKHVIVSMPYRFWMKCKRPVDFIGRLDAVYELYADWTDGIAPFGGEKVKILNVDNMYFNMSSGNPILSRDSRIEYIVGELEKSDYRNPSWGLMHELGHDFVYSAMKQYFVFGDGDNESWAEFFALYGCQKLGLEPDKEPTWKARVAAYHKSGEKVFDRIRMKDEKWLMIGFLHHIRDHYGWDVYKKLFKSYAGLIRAKKYLEFDETQKKVDLFVKELSLAAGENLYPYFIRWGFPVSQTVGNELEHLPKATFLDE